MADFFDAKLAPVYDEKNARLAPIADNMHFLIRLLLQGLPDNAQVLCVGIGTGAEILSLASSHPHWRFTGVDPSAAMLEVCQERLNKAGIADRCQLVHGYVEDVPAVEHFDAVLSILVGHFVAQEERTGFYRAMQQRLKPGGFLVNTEISFDLDSAAFPSMLDNWKQVQTLMGATAESLTALPDMLRNVLSVLPPVETERHLQAAGISLPVRFFQAFMICGWYGVKV